METIYTSTLCYASQLYATSSIRLIVIAYWILSVSPLIAQPAASSWMWRARRTSCIIISSTLELSCVKKKRRSPFPDSVLYGSDKVYGGWDTQLYPPFWNASCKFATFSSVQWLPNAPLMLLCTLFGACLANVPVCGAEAIRCTFWVLSTHPDMSGHNMVGLGTRLSPSPLHTRASGHPVSIRFVR